MKLLKNKIAAIAIAIFFMLSMTASMMLIPNANAHSPPWNIPTTAFCAVSPNPIGVEQEARVNFWLGEPPPTATAQFGDRWQDLTVKVTSPSGTTTTLGPFTSDATGGSHTTFTPTTVGNYTFQLAFPGQTLAGNNPPPGGWFVLGPFSGGAAFIGDYYESSTSNVVTLTVQSTAIASAPVTPLPTTYWSRPINAINNNWYSIAGNWLGFAASAFANTGMYNGSVDYNPYTTAPTTAHILWTKPEAFGGTIGGEFGGSEESNFYSTSQYEPKFAPIIINGILYYEQYPGSSTNPTGFTAVNIQTGQTLWTDNADNYGGGSPMQTALTASGSVTVLRCGQINDVITPDQYGALAYLWTTGTPAGINAAPFTTTYNMFDAMTGDYILSIVNGTSMSLTEDEHGGLIGYYVNDTNLAAPTLNMWNSTVCINLASAGGIGAGPISLGPSLANSWVWRPPQDAQIPFALGIMWSKPIATSISGVPLPFSPFWPGLEIFDGGVDSGVVFLVDQSSGGGLGYNLGFWIEAGYSAATGQQLWIENVTEVPYTLVSTGAGTYSVGDGIHAEFTQNTFQLAVYSLFTGKQLWVHTVPNARPYDSLGANMVVANGTIYLWGYGGDVWAYNIATGDLEWQYQTPSGGFESPYGYYNLWCFSVGTVAGGLLFLPEGHMYSPPLYHGCQQLALNITNGQVVWSIDAFDVTSAPAVSDGIATTLNAYDNQIYAYGKGPSATTVTAPDVGVTTATPVTITGTVMDISAGSQQNAVAANFPHGLPCVSDASMSQFMEAVYEQQPMPTNVTGVPVTIAVTDSNHNCYDIGTATTNANGFYSLIWTPIIPGNYTVTATFAGTQSYYGSSANAAFYASSPPPTPAPTASPPSGLASTGTVELGIAAVIIVIVIIGAVLAILTLRKRP